MARSSKTESVEKFRFRVAIEDPETLLFGTLNLSAAPGVNEDIFLQRFGFSEVVLPKSNVNVITYRENNYLNRSSKQPGLVSYEPVVLRRAVTKDKYLYNWYKEVHNEATSYAPGVSAALSNFGVPPSHSTTFRRDMIISSYDREGKVIKNWYCFNCFPVSYKGGNDFDAQSNEKLLEELVITYESFVELGDGPINEQLLKESLSANAKAALSKVAGSTIASLLT